MRDHVIIDVFIRKNAVKIVFVKIKNVIVGKNENIFPAEKRQKGFKILFAVRNYYVVLF